VKGAQKKKGKKKQGDQKKSMTAQLCWENRKPPCNALRRPTVRLQAMRWTRSNSGSSSAKKNGKEENLREETVLNRGGRHERMEFTILRESGNTRVGKTTLCWRQREAVYPTASGPKRRTHRGTATTKPNWVGRRIRKGPGLEEKVFSTTFGACNSGGEKGTDGVGGDVLRRTMGTKGTKANRS